MLTQVVDNGFPFVIDSFKNATVWAKGNNGTGIFTFAFFANAFLGNTNFIFLDPNFTITVYFGFSIGRQSVHNRSADAV